MAKIKNTDNPKCLQGCKVAKTLIHCLWAKWYSHSGKFWKFLIKLNINLPYDPAISQILRYPIFPGRMTAYV